MSSDDPRPPLALRIGVTGTRHFLPGREIHLRRQIAEVLTRVRDDALLLAADPAAVPIYREPPAGQPLATLQIVSPLAEGADRLVAEEGLKLGYEIVSPLPFSRAEYEMDFTDSIDVFRDLAAQSTVIELDGARGPNETASYEAVGRFVVHNCDLLIAIWDGKTTGKRGGTAEITRFAAKSGVPIWWIEADADTDARWIGNATQWTTRLSPPHNPAMEILRAYLSDIVLPPGSAPKETRNVLGHAAHHLTRRKNHENAPLRVFLAEVVRPAASRLAWPWRVYPTALAYLAPPPGRHPSDAVPPESPPDGYWDAIYRRADGLSVDYANRYRSSYLLIILFAFAIVLVEKIGLFIGERALLIAMACEFLLLLGIAALAILNHASDWHERWINYRLLAELCREQSIIAPLGVKLPRPEVTRLAAANAEGQSQFLPREIWVAWYVEAASRAAPWPESSATAKKHALELGRNLALHQASYHRARSIRSEIADRRLGEFGEYCFLATVIAVGFRLLLGLAGHGSHVSEAMESLATLLSAASAAFIAIRFYSEFGLLDRQSMRMRRVMIGVQEELSTVELEKPLSSVELGRILLSMSASMLQDIGGWAELFRIRAVEAG